MAKNKPFKKLATKQTPHFSIPELINYEIRKPAFSFHDIQYQGDLCLTKCDDTNKALIVDKLLKLSQLTWKQIDSSPKDTYGYEHIPYTKFIVTLPATVTRETTLLVFRFSHTGRIAGYRLKDILHVVAVSTTHSLY